ncbi:MAG: hypothetical protein RLZZ522_410 [Verrucomicrobiota bacterium]|jgi:small subunit ribosomal protein S16
MVKIRLRKTGKLNAPSFRIVVADVRSPRDGAHLEVIGFYNPRLGTEKVDLARVDHWIGVGAQPTGTVVDIVRRARTGETVQGKKAEYKAKQAAEGKKD